MWTASNPIPQMEAAQAGADSTGNSVRGYRYSRSGPHHRPSSIWRSWMVGVLGSVDLPVSHGAHEELRGEAAGLAVRRIEVHRVQRLEVEFQEAHPVGDVEDREVVRVHRLGS